MSKQLNTDEWLKEIGQSIRSLRLRQNLDQRELTKQAGVALNALKNLERGAGATVSSLIRVICVLGREDWLDALAPQVTISPLQMLKDRHPRKRARRKAADKHV